MPFRFFFVLVAAWAGVAPVDALARPVHIELRGEVLAVHRQLTLADVAVVRADDPAVASAVGGLALGHAPRVGYADRFGRAQLVALLAQRQGLTAERVDWGGAKCVTVRAASQMLPATRLVAVAEQWAQTALAERGTVPTIEAATVPDLEVPAGTVELRARPLTLRHPGGHLPVWIDVRVDGELYRSQVVALSLSDMRPVLVARHVLAGGAEATPADFEPALRNVATIESAAAQASALPPRWRMRRALRDGDVLESTMVPTPGGVSAGDPVQVALRQGGLAIEAGAVALDAAGPSQALRVRVNQGGEILTGRLLSDHVVMVNAE